MATVQPRILIVLDGEHHAAAPDRELALGVAMAYSALKRIDADVIFACDGGGFPLVAGHMRQFPDNPAIAGFLANHTARSDIADALTIQQIVVDDFDLAVFFPTDPTDLGPASELTRAFLDQGKMVVLPNGSSYGHDLQGTTVIRRSATDLEWMNSFFR